MKPKTKKKLKKNFKFILIGIFLLLIVGFVVAEVIEGLIDSQFEQKVIRGRALVDEYRTAHNRQYERGVKVIDIESRLYNDLILNLSSIGYDDDFNVSIGEFFNDSELYNIQSLGYDNREDFYLRANETDQIIFREMWN